MNVSNAATMQVGALRLSILIPTRTCDSLLATTLNNVSTLNSSCVEIVIANNSDCDDVITRLNIKDTRIREIRSGPGLSMSENWMVAIREARGDFFIFVGADDGILSSHVDAFLESNILDSADSVTSHVIFLNHPGELEPGFVDLPEIPCNRRVRHLKWPIFSGAIFHQNSFDLPQPYNRAIVRTEIIKPLLGLNKIPGFAPDVFLAHWVAQSSRNGAFYEEALFIHGGSVNSTGRTYTRNEASTFTDSHSLSVLSSLSRWRKSVVHSCQLMGSVECAVIAFEIRTGFTFPFKSLLRLWVTFTCLETCHMPRNHFIGRSRSFVIRWSAFLWRLRWMGPNGRKVFLHSNIRRDIPPGFNLGTVTSYTRLIKNLRT